MPTSPYRRLISLVHFGLLFVVPAAIAGQPRVKPSTSPGLRVSPDACLPNVPRLSADRSNGLWQARRPPPAWQRINFPVAGELTQIQGVFHP